MAVEVIRGFESHPRRLARLTERPPVPTLGEGADRHLLLQVNDQGHNHDALVRNHSSVARIACGWGVGLAPNARSNFV